MFKHFISPTLASNIKARSKTSPVRHKKHSTYFRVKFEFVQEEQLLIIGSKLVLIHLKGNIDLRQGCLLHFTPAAVFMDGCCTEPGVHLENIYIDSSLSHALQPILLRHGSLLRKEFRPYWSPTPLVVYWRL